MNKTGTNTREKLVETAMDLIWKSGYSSVSVDEICKAADIRKGSFYHFFPSKIDLAVAAIDEAFNRFRPFFDEAFGSSIPALQRFELLADHGFEHQEEVAKQYGMVCGCPFMTLGAEMAPQNESIRNKTNEIMMFQKEYFEHALVEMVLDGLLPKDTNVKSKASKIHSFIMGQLVMARIENSLEPMKNELKSGIFSLIGAQQDVLEVA